MLSKLIDSSRFDKMLITFVCIYFLTTIEAFPCTGNQHCALCLNDGRCSSECENGYYGSKCKLKCSIGCTNNTCQMSSIGIEVCKHGCKRGYYGTICTIPCMTHLNTCRKCPQECEGGFCQLESSCAGKCQDSYYGTACKSCPAWCEVCNRISGTCEVCLHCEGDCSHGCTERCEPGYFGVFCEDPCSSGCLSGCDQISGACFRCTSGWFGVFCKKQCPDRCSDKECDEDGKCTNGCTKGWFGTKCELQCPERCLFEDCDKVGICSQGCTSGWYGQKCESKCRSGCEAGRCDRNGTCINGCREELYGDKCQNICPLSCFNNLCDVKDGTCKSCKKSFYGRHCHMACVRCENGSCTQETGRCIQGCLPNYRGEFCQHDCKGDCTTEECRNICKIASEFATPLEKAGSQRYLIGGIALAFIVLLVIFVYVMYPLIRNSRSAQNDSINGQQQALTENMSTDNRQPPCLCFQLVDVTGSPQDLCGTHPSVNEGSPLSLSHRYVNVQNENETPLSSREIFVADSYSHRQDVATTAKRVPESSECGYLPAISPSGDEEMYVNCQAKSGGQERYDETDWNQRVSADQDSNLDFEEIGILYEEESLASDTNGHVYVNFRGMYQSVCR